MCYKIIQFVSVITLNFVLAPVEACKVYCLSCPSDLDHPSYYCCMEDWGTKVSGRNCGTESAVPPTTLEPTEPPTEPPTPTPCPTPVQSNRCPEVDLNSTNNCNSYQKLLPNPTRCNSDNDCISPFNVCCEDTCFSMKICKTYINVEIE